ncbi:hypothetical protein MKW94_005369, partial [Papaver nudicaule]|nr:hypothetical protein [Papaver nudicaule]
MCAFKTPQELTNMHSRIPILLVLLLILHLSCFHVIVPVSAKVFLSIDCGYSSSEPFTDENSIEWVGDQQYVQTGESRNVMDTTKDRPWNTVREFTTRKKNCYSLDISKAEDITKVERVLVRASFHYGNYDNEGNPPTFNLQFNGNNWSQVVTSMNDTTYEEVVFSLKQGSTISVCLSQTQRIHFPFISALEVRSVDSDMYSYVDSNYPLMFKLRKRYGNSTNLRYPEDKYDRIWIADVSDPIFLPDVVNTSPSVRVNISDKIPEAIFKTAVTNRKSSGEIWDLGTITNLSVPLHFNAYFSEVIRLNSTQKRSFNILINKPGVTGVSVYDTVIPPYGDALQVRIENATTYRTDHWYIGFVPTEDSTLPPLINALEVFVIGDTLVQGTNSND